MFFRLYNKINVLCFHRDTFIQPWKYKFITFNHVNFRKKDWGSHKLHRNVKLHFDMTAVNDPEIEKVLAPLRALVKEQGDLVRNLKANGAPELDVKKAIDELKVRKKHLDDKEHELTPASAYFDRNKMEDVLIRRFFYDHSFSIYGGIAGQYDFGPMGCSLKTNILNEWRSFFVLEEQMLEVDASILTPEPVLKASGHVDRFADLMVKDTSSGECFRLDHLIKGHLEKLMKDKTTSVEFVKKCEDLITKLDGFNKDQLAEIVREYDMKSPSTGNALSEPIEFNLMFMTQIGPSGLIKGFLRPETAQGIFVNFKRLLEFNQGKLPFAAAQIGNAFRNEISPRAGLLRVREFTMAEIEHFCDPDDKSHNKFVSVSDGKMLLYSACNQMDGQPPEYKTIGDAVAEGLVANETLGYFMARIHKFLIHIGIEEKRVRFRQHMSNEMAHYACDCWDAECLTSYGWIECVGCADRSAYDLKQHYKATGIRLAAEKKLKEPKTIDVEEVVPNKAKIGSSFRSDAKLIIEAIKQLNEVQISQLQMDGEELGSFTVKLGDGREFALPKGMGEIKKYSKVVHVEEMIPSVIEPSFGIGRILYALLEHSFRIREEDEQRTYFALPAVVAPIKCCVLPLSGNEAFVPLSKQISSDLLKEGISWKIDDSSGSIGRRYTRSDEIAIPYCVTIDFDSLTEPHTITLRERNSTEQLRIPVSVISGVVNDLSRGRLTWTQAKEKYPKFEQQQISKSSN